MYRQQLRSQGITKVSPRPIYRPVATPTPDVGKDRWAIALSCSILMGAMVLSIPLCLGIQNWNKSQESLQIEALQRELKQIRFSVCDR